MILPPYLFKLSICLVLIYLVYWAFFRKLTFHTWNRWYLFVLSLLSFALPLVNLHWFVSEEEKLPLAGVIPAVDNILGKQTADGQFIHSYIYLLLAAGSLIFFIRLLVQVVSFFRLKRSADVIADGSVTIYRVHEPILPFSFANSIFIPSAQHDEKELTEIIRHEYIHVKQRHTVDVMVGELLVMLNWYNPFAWLIRKAIRQNLEFIADERVLRSGFNRKEYQYLLLKVIGMPAFSIASSFNFNSLKKRIEMMNRNKSARIQLARFGLVLPIVVLSLVAFRSQQGPQAALVKVTMADTIPANKIKPEDISSMDVTGKKIKITLKNGQQEEYNTEDSSEKEAFEKRFGPLNRPTPPPPPPAPAIKMPVDVSSINITKENGKDQVHIVKTDGSVEDYNLNDAAEKAAFEQRYGKLTPPPPPPAAPVAPVAPKAPTPATLPGLPPVPPVPAQQDNISSVNVIKKGNVRKIEVTFKNGTKKSFDLNKVKEKLAFEQEFGPLNPPPPPAAPTAPDAPEPPAADQ